MWDLVSEFLLYYRIIFLSLDHRLGNKKNNRTHLIFDGVLVGKDINSLDISSCFVVFFNWGATRFEVSSLSYRALITRKKRKTLSFVFYNALVSNYMHFDLI